jgi:ABC-2 type transport system ATP-binding protein
VAGDRRGDGREPPSAGVVDADLEAGGSAAAELHGVRKVYRRRGRSIVALEPLTLSVERGETVALVGPNGVGKSTALRILATLVEPSAGRAIVLGHDVVREGRTIRRTIGVSLGGARSFYWRLSARHNLIFFGRLRGLVGPELRDAIHESSSALGILDVLDAPVRQLSRGVLARLGVARAILGDPPLVLLDEPFAAVDSVGRGLLRGALAVRNRRGAAVIMATHDETQARRCDRVWELTRRRVSSDRRPSRWGSAGRS